jgi:threonine aldolase
LKAAGVVYHPWTQLSLPATEGVADNEVLIRLVTSFATPEDEVRKVLDIARSALGQQAAE